MLKPLRPKRIERQAISFKNDLDPSMIKWSGGKAPAVIYYSDNSRSYSVCIRCMEPPCMYYSDQEIQLEVFKDFPFDKNNEVCPTAAISWENGNSFPQIDPELCIYCGLCIQRCPARAIYFSDDSAIIISEPNNHLIEVNELVGEENLNKTTQKFNSSLEKGIFLLEDNQTINVFKTKLDSHIPKQSAQFPNHLSRNLLIGVGIGALMRRLGDVNIRMDLLLGPPGINQGTGEVEFGDGILDAPRNILDNIAILVNKYRSSKELIIPLVVMYTLPNSRSDYWLVVKDIRRVLGINIQTVTIGMLAIVLWNKLKLSINRGTEFYIDTDDSSLRDKLGVVLKRNVNVSLDLGFLESEK